MPKRILVRESSFINFLKSFFKAKSDGKEDQWINSVKKQDANLGKVWQDYNDSVDQKWNTIYNVMKKRGIDTSDIENDMKKRGVSVDSKKSLY